jgi:hypothetical protein
MVLDLLLLLLLLASVVVVVGFCGVARTAFLGLLSTQILFGSSGTPASPQYSHATWLASIHRR